MLIKILKIARSEPEELEIRCHEETEEVKDIVTFVKSRQGKLKGIFEGQQYEIPVADVYYVETVDNTVFIYGREKVYEAKQKLYELEGILKEKYLWASAPFAHLLLIFIPTRAQPDALDVTV